MVFPCARRRSHGGGGGKRLARRVRWRAELRPQTVEPTAVQYSADQTHVGVDYETAVSETRGAPPGRNRSAEHVRKERTVPASQFARRSVRGARRVVAG